jgi:hypothetical protein
MQRLYTAADPILVGFLKSILLDSEIACIVRNELLIGGSGELPSNECWPEIWVLDAADLPRAQAVLDEALSEAGSAEGNWTCDACGETSESQFGACWNCGNKKS